MATFRFGGHEKGSPDSGSNPLDALINMAGGHPLPGWWGAIQAVVNVWTKEQPMPGATRLQWGMWGGKAILNTIGVYRAYQAASNPMATKERDDPIADFVAAAGLLIPDGFEGLANLVHVYSTELPVTDRSLGAEGRARIRTFTLPGGVEFHFTFSYYNERDDAVSAKGNAFYGRGPYVAPDELEAFRVAISEVIWAREGGADLQLSAVYQGWDNVQFVLGNIGDPDDYVSSGSSAAWTSVAKLSHRCNAFRAKGLSRKIMFYGPPGCGKTTLARSLARSIGLGHTLRIEPAAIEHAGTTAVMRFVRLLRPEVILFDDLDRSANQTAEILHYMERSTIKEAWTEGLITIGTVNTLTELDPALLRPGRFDEVQHVEEPCADHRAAIVAHYLTKFGLDLPAAEMSDRMAGLAPAEIREVIACVSTVGVEHFDAELGRIRLQRALYAGEKVAEYLAKTR